MQDQVIIHLVELLEEEVNKKKRKEGRKVKIKNMKRNRKVYLHLLLFL